MKSYFILLGCVVLCFIGCSQATDKVKVPDVVKTKLESLYPNTNALKWEMEDGKYEATFKASGSEISVIF